MFRMSPLLVCASLALTTPVSAQPQRPAAHTVRREDPKAKDKTWTHWLMQVQHVDRSEPAGEDDARLGELAAKAASAADTQERRRLEHELERERSNAKKRAGFIVYGWRQSIDAASGSNDSVHSMTAFIVPYSDQHGRLFASLKEDDWLTFPREGSKELFTCDGRRFVLVTGATKTQDPKDRRTKFAKFEKPPRGQDARTLSKAFDCSLKFVKTDPREQGGHLHRYMINIHAKSPPASARELKVWLHIRIDASTGPEETRNSPAGPIIELVELKQGKDGAFRTSRSFEFITHGPTTLDTESATAEVIAATWSNQG